MSGLVLPDDKAAKSSMMRKELRLTMAIRLAVAEKVHDEEIAVGLFECSKPYWQMMAAWQGLQGSWKPESRSI